MMIRFALRYLAVMASIVILVWQNAALAETSAASSTSSVQQPGARSKSAAPLRETVSKWRASPEQAQRNERQNRSVVEFATGVPVQKSKPQQAAK